MLTQTCNPGFKQSMCCRALFSYINPMNSSFCNSPVKIYMSILPHSCLYSSENVAASHKGPLTSGITTGKATAQARRLNNKTKLNLSTSCVGDAAGKEEAGGEHRLVQSCATSVVFVGRTERWCYFKMPLSKLLNSSSPANCGHILHDSIFHSDIPDQIPSGIKL